MYIPTGHSVEDYLFRVPLDKLEHYLQCAPEELPPEDYALAENILRLRKEALALREKYPRQLLEQWNTEQRRQLLYTALRHEPLWVYEDIIHDILEIWELAAKATPVELSQQEWEYLRNLWENTRN